MAAQTPWIFIAVAGVPLFMIYVKTRRMDAKETHELQMRVKYHSEFWAKGNDFVRTHSGYVQKHLRDTTDTLLGAEITGPMAIAAGIDAPQPWWRVW